MWFTGNDCKNMKNRKSVFIIGLLLLLLFCDKNKVYALDAAVNFGQDSYTIDEEEFEIEVLLKADGNIGIYKVILRYDTNRMEYISGAEEEADGRITLEGTGFGSEVAYLLEFRAIGPGSAGLVVEDALIYSAEDSEIGYEISSLAKVPVDIQGQETGELSFFEGLNEEEHFGMSGTDIPIIGDITDENGNILYIIDMADYEPDITLWDYTLVTGTYLKNDLTYISDQARNVRVVLMIDERKNLYLYAYKEETQDFYSVNEIETEGETVYILSPGACINVSEEILKEALEKGTVFYAIRSNGESGYYRYTASGTLQEWRQQNEQNGNTENEDKEAENGENQNLIYKVLIIFGFILIVNAVLITGIKFGPLLKNRLKIVKIYLEDKKQYIFVIKELTGREVKRKYARSHLGIIWSVLNPLLMMIVMSMVFSYMFKRSIDNFPLYYLTGSLFWNLFSDGTSHAMSALIDNKSLLVKAKLPRQTFVISRMVTALVNLGYSCIPYALMLVVFGIRPSWTMLFLPLDVILIFVFTMGIGYILSILYVFFADIKYLYGVFLRILIYLTALFYPVTSLPGSLQKLIGYNPVYLSIYIARECMVYGNVPHYSAWIKLTLAAAASFSAGWIIFRKKQNDIMQKI